MFWQTPPPLYPHVAAEIIEMTKADQAIRQQWIGEISKQKYTSETIGRMSDVDAYDTKEMKRIVDDFGWPTPAMVGKEAAHDAWLLVQHADADRPFQKRCLDLMAPLVKRGEADGGDYAYLFDRVLVGEHKLQKYGTQGTVQGGIAWIQPVEAPDKVDAYRKAIGLQPLEQYLDMLAGMYKAKVAPDWRARLRLPPTPAPPGSGKTKG